jgi:hypothetical protein
VGCCVGGGDLAACGVSASQRERRALTIARRSSLQFSLIRLCIFGARLMSRLQVRNIRQLQGLLQLKARKKHNARFQDLVFFRNCLR